MVLFTLFSINEINRKDVRKFPKLRLMKHSDFSVLRTERIVVFPLVTDIWTITNSSKIRQLGTSVNGMFSRESN